MEINILDSIMFKGLRPWVIDTTNKRRFAELVKPANAGSPATCGELQKQLKNLLSDFPAEQKNLDDSPPTAKAVVRPAFYEIELPKPHDVFTQFYFYLITKEALRASNLLIQETETHTNEKDILYNAKQALKSIRRLIKKTADELRESGFTTFPDENSEFKHFVLFTLKQKLFTLFFEVQERYRKVLTDFETEETFSLTVLNENHSAISQLKPTAAFFEFHIENIIAENKFSQTETVDFLKKIQNTQDAKLQTLQAALENFVFFRFHDISVENLTIENLTNAETVKKYLTEAKTTVTQSLNQFTYGHQRLEVITTALDELDYIQFQSVNKVSIPLSLYHWLQKQKEVYQQNASSVFATDETGEEAIGKKQKPLSKKDKATTEQQKSFAAEHLKFMSGANVQQEKIMQDNDFKRMMEYSYHLIETGKLPTDIKQIPQINIPTQHIRYTYYIIHKNLYGTKGIKKEWIDFLHKVFKQFSNTEKKTTKTKFSTKPQNYDSDMRSLEK